MSRRKLTKITKQLKGSAKMHASQAKALEKLSASLSKGEPVSEEDNPRIPRKKGQPAGSKKHSDLYTDENPKGTIKGLGFKTPSDARSSVTKIRKSGRSKAHKTQAAVSMEQRARVMGKSGAAAVYRKFIDSNKKKSVSEELRQSLVEKCWPGYEKKGMKTMFGKRYPNCVKKKAKLKESMEKLSEEGLRDWFGKSRSKGGKPGWVQVVSGKPCARQPGQKTTPKCVSSAKRASMSKAERLSAQRRKRKADPGQPQKTGAAKPTYVPTDKPKKKSK
jgi:hypothetical protein|tara:strand:+ start:861 stop:1688 length:828 start_codon:yes stop_codon:yes gene_type:complete